MVRADRLMAAPISEDQAAVAARSMAVAVVPTLALGLEEQAPIQEAAAAEASLVQAASA